MNACAYRIRDLAKRWRCSDNTVRAMIRRGRARQIATCDYVIEWGGKRVLSVKKGIEAAAKRAGLECTPHVLRHSAACLLAESGVPMAEISAYLDHTDIRTTIKHYAHFHPDYQRKAAGALEL